jgi:hypothetical protein
MLEIVADTRVETLVVNTVRKIVDANPRRFSLMLVNRSATDAEIGFDSGIATTGGKRGIPLLASQGNTLGFGPMITGDGKVIAIKGSIYAISTAAIDITIAEESIVEE